MNTYYTSHTNKPLTAKQMAENAHGFVKNYAFTDEEFQIFVTTLCKEQRIMDEQLLAKIGLANYIEGKIIDNEIPLVFDNI